ncbi:hypothetical protein GCM10017556_53450 [Micromonospora sagamiensis]|nr:hypothetical protein GCM10017556_53450 [Micromonospora sagamiensis]
MTRAKPYALGQRGFRKGGSFRRVSPGRPIGVDRSVVDAALSPTMSLPPLDDAVVTDIAPGQPG